jgi:hypothetical protein
MDDVYLCAVDLTITSSRLVKIKVSSSISWGWRIYNATQEDLVKYGYMLEKKVQIHWNPSMYWQVVKT